MTKSFKTCCSFIRSAQESVFLVAVVSLLLAIIHMREAQAGGSPFVLQCNDNERISRIVVRTGRRVDFLGIECKVPGRSAGRIIKTGGTGGSRHEFVLPANLFKVHISKGKCNADSTRVCSIQFELENGTKSPVFGRETNSRTSLGGNGEVYGFYGRSGTNIDDLKALTRKLFALPDPVYDIEGVLKAIQAKMRKPMGFVAVIRNPAGKRVGFVRAGWAIHPEDPELGRHAGQFDVHTMAAVGSTTKAWATAAAVVKLDEFTVADTLGTEFGQYLPRRWRSELNSRFDRATVLDVIKHRAGFRRSGPSTQQTGGEMPARFRLRTGENYTNANRNGPLPGGTSAPYTRIYSNTAGGLFHFTLPHMMLASVSGAPVFETSIARLSDADYDRRYAEFAGAFYEEFVQEHILAPVGARATCDTREFLGVRQVAAAYVDRGDTSGVLPASSTNHCASGGWVISANDLTKVLNALTRDNDVLQPLSRVRLLNAGPNRVWDVMTGNDHTHNGLHDGLRAAVIIRNDRYTAALIYNSPPVFPINNQQLLVDAFQNNKR